MKGVAFRLQLLAVIVSVLAGWILLDHRADTLPLQTPVAFPAWEHVSTETGDLVVPGSNLEQTATLVFDIDRDALNDFVIALKRAPGPGVVWYRRTASGWDRNIVETDAMQAEAGGAFHDIDGDGDDDIILGGNGNSREIWWWENPYPVYSPNTDWKRHLIKDTGATQHHDLTFGNFDDDAADELVYWNQNADGLFIVDVPVDPAATEPWPGHRRLATTPDKAGYYEGLHAYNMDGDGDMDLVGGGRWYERTGAGFTEHVIDDLTSTKFAVGQLIPGGWPEVVSSTSDRAGAIHWYTTTDGLNWVSTPLGAIDFGHSLDLGDIDGDGQMDIFVAEMTFTPSSNRYNPDARTMIFYGDGQGEFTADTIATGIDNHESRLADLDGDDDLDILGKPYDGDTPRLDIWLNQSGVSTCSDALEDWQTYEIDPRRPYRVIMVDAADLNGDDYPDIVTGGWWYENPHTPAGDWERHVIGTPLAQMAALWDFDGDGDVDILGTVSNDPDKPWYGNAFVWAENNGSGAFTLHNNVAVGEGGYLQGLAIGAFQSGETEIILSWERNSPLQRLTVPRNPVRDRWPISIASNTRLYEGLSAGDIDGDRDQDLLLGTTWLRNDGPNRDWVANTVFETGSESDRNRLADINGDRRLDAVIGYESVSGLEKVAWYEWDQENPESAWAEHPIASVIGPMSLDVADMDGDRDLDVVVGEHNLSHPEQARMLVFENRDGAGLAWVEHEAGRGHEHHMGARTVDLDRDGDLDIVSIGWGARKVLVYEYRGCLKKPSLTPTATTPSGSPTPTSTSFPTPTATPPTSHDLPFEDLYLSSTSSGVVGGIRFADEDILYLDRRTGEWRLFFDGSDVGLKAADVDAFDLSIGNTLYLSFADPVGALPGLPGPVDDSDIVSFSGTFGSATSGNFALYFDGSDVGLTTAAEDIDAVSFLPGGRLLVSLVGDGMLGKLAAADEDIFSFQPRRTGSDTRGQWALYFDGSDVGLSDASEDLSGLWADPSSQSLYFSTFGGVRVSGVSGDDDDIVRCLPGALGQTTSCQLGFGVAWDGGLHGVGREKLDGISLR